MKKRRKNKKRKQGMTRRDFAMTSMAAAALPGLPGCKEPEGNEATGAPEARPAAATTAGTTRKASRDWKEGTTLPAEYYLDAEHFVGDERFLADNVWLLADHESRIPRVGDYFTFQFGRGENVIVLRDDASDVRAFHNACRHRGSRLCRESVHPGPETQGLSILQLGPSGNTAQFRCPYHGWTYDLQGNLVKAYMKPRDFDLSQNGLHPCRVRVEGGHVFVTLSRGDEAPPFGSGFAGFASDYGLAGLKVGVRESYSVEANWKLLIENFVECYHCGPSHKNLTTTHNWDYRLTEEEKAYRAEEMKAWLGGPPRGDWWAYEGELNPGFVTGSLDGKPVAPLLPNRKEWTHQTLAFTTGYTTSYWQAYDDHVVAARFTPRDVRLIECEVCWLVHPDAVEGKDFEPDNLKALWDSTFREDMYLCENQHRGILSGSYTPGRYFDREDRVAGFASWYMSAVARG